MPPGRAVRLSDLGGDAVREEVTLHYEVGSWALLGCPSGEVNEIKHLFTELKTIIIYNLCLYPFTLNVKQ